jgi:hypothetical protein
MTSLHQKNKQALELVRDLARTQSEINKEHATRARAQSAQAGVWKAISGGLMVAASVLIAAWPKRK